MGRRIHACALSGPPRAECCLASESVPGEIYQDPYTDECSGSGALCGDDLSDGKRHYYVQACIRIFAHQWRDGNSKAGPHGCLLLGLCADGVSPGTPLGNDSVTVSADVWDGQELWDPPYSSPDRRGLNRRLRPVCICDKRSGDLHVPEDTVCVPGLQ